MKIIFTGGGTGGHTYPAIALIKALREEDPQVKILYVGKKGATEEHICIKESIDFIGLEVSYLHRKKIHKNITTFRQFMKALKQSREIIKAFGPDVVVGTGGYVSAPVVKASHQLKIKTIIHEQNTIPGLTNKLLSRYAKYVAISFKESERYFKHGQIVYTGNPRAYEMSLLHGLDKSSIGLSQDTKLIVIFFGSLGAKYLNLKMVDVVKALSLRKNTKTIFVTGKSHYDDILSKMKGVSTDTVDIRAYLDNLPMYLKIADLVVCRCGATTIAELMALSKPAIYIPSPYVSNNHQEKNAKMLQDAKVGIMMKEQEVNVDKLVHAIDDLLTNQSKLSLFENNCKQLANIEGIHQFIDIIKS